MRIFASSNLNPPPLPPSSSASCFSSFVSTCVYRHDSVSPTPVYAKLKPMFCVSSSRFSSAWISLQCAGFDSAHASRNMRMFFFVPISIVVLAIGLLCHSYTFYVPIPCQSTCFCAEQHLHGQPFYVRCFPKTLVHTLLRFKFKPWSTKPPCFV